VAVGTDVSKLPEPLAHHVLEFLRGEEVARCERVNRSWQKMCQSRALWRELTLNAFPEARAEGVLDARARYRELRAARLAAERERAQEQAVARREQMCEGGQEFLRFFGHGACNSCYILFFVLFTVLLPLRFDGFIDATWTQAFSPLIAFSLLVVLQAVGTVVRACLWPRLWEARGPHQALIIKAGRGFGDGWLWHLLLLAASLVWLLCVLLAVAKLDGTSFDGPGPGASETIDVSWRAIAALLLVPIAAACVCFVLAGRALGGAEAFETVLAVQLGYAALFILCSWASLLMAAVNADAIVSGEPELPVEWDAVFVPLWIAFAILTCCSCCSGPLYECFFPGIDPDHMHLGLPVFLTVALAPPLIAAALINAKLNGSIDPSLTAIFVTYFVADVLMLFLALGLCLASFEDG
jgi:hypothetical protein